MAELVLYFTIHCADPAAGCWAPRTPPELVAHFANRARGRVLAELVKPQMSENDVVRLLGNTGWGYRSAGIHEAYYPALGIRIEWNEPVGDHSLATRLGISDEMLEVLNATSSLWVHRIALLVSAIDCAPPPRVERATWYGFELPKIPRSARVIRKDPGRSGVIFP